MIVLGEGYSRIFEPKKLLWLYVTKLAGDMVP